MTRQKAAKVGHDISQQEQPEGEFNIKKVSRGECAHKKSNQRSFNTCQREYNPVSILKDKVHDSDGITHKDPRESGLKIHCRKKSK